MNQVLVAIHAALFITGSGIYDRSVGQHGPAFVWNIKYISMAFLALLVLKGGIGLLAVLFMIIRVLGKMNDNIPDPMHGLGIEEVICIIGSWQMTVHAVSHKPLGIVRVSGCLPCIVGKPDFVAPCAELRR
jgi:hypothetical protein